jgi:hypothetical protein
MSTLGTFVAGYALRSVFLSPLVLLVACLSSLEDELLSRAVIVGASPVVCIQIEVKSGQPTTGTPVINTMVTIPANALLRIRI